MRTYAFLMEIVLYGDALEGDYIACRALASKIRRDTSASLDWAPRSS